LPLPPPTFAAWPLPTVTTDVPQQRIHQCRWGALYFGAERKNRFNAPDGEYGVVYLGADLHVAFVETFGRLGSTHELMPAVISRAQLADSCVSEVTFLRPVVLADLTGPGLRRSGADARLLTCDHVISREWSRAIWAHPARPDGLRYHSRLDPGRSNIALFSRAQDAVQAGPPRRLSDLPLDVIADLCDTYGFQYRAI
jgi:hypothetical protein